MACWLQEESGSLQKALSSERERSAALQRDLGAFQKDNQEATHREKEIMAQLEQQDQVRPHKQYQTASAVLQARVCSDKHSMSSDVMPGCFYMFQPLSVCRVLSTQMLCDCCKLAHWPVQHFARPSVDSSLHRHMCLQDPYLAHNMDTHTSDHSSCLVAVQLHLQALLL